MTMSLEGVHDHVIGGGTRPCHWRGNMTIPLEGVHDHVIGGVHDHVIGGGT